MFISIRLKIKNTLACLVLLALVGSYAVVARADLVATINATEITTDQTLQLTITSTLSQGEPNLNVLAADFEVLGRSSQSNIETVGQRMTHTRSWVFELLPKRRGVFTIPAFEVGGEKSEPLQISVSEPPVTQAGEDKGGYFLETSIDNPTPYVQAQVLYTLRVYAVQKFVDGSLSDPEAEGLLVQKLGDGREYTERRYGRIYSVIERQYALFPQRSGQYILPAAVLNARVPADGTRTRGFFTPTKPVRRRSEAITLEVMPRPEDSGKGWWLPAKSVQLAARWDGDTSSLRSGESVTRTVSLLADGVGSTQLPAIELPQATDFKIYANQPELGEGVAAGGVQSQRVEKWAVVARKPGELTLPEIRVPWFNVTTGQPEVAVIPAETLQVLPAISSDSTEQAPTDLQAPATPQSEAVQTPLSPDSTLSLTTGLKSAPQTSPVWKWATLMMGLVWLLTAASFLWYWRHTGRARSSSVTHDADRQEASVRQVVQACASGDLQQGNKALLAWARGHWPQDPPRNLAAIGRRLESAPLVETFRILDSSKYAKPASPSDSTENHALAAKALQALPDQLRAALRAQPTTAGAGSTSTLPAL